MERVQVYLPKEELAALRKAAKRSGRSAADLIREAIRRFVVAAQAKGPVAIWDGTPKRTSVEHDAI
jgi:metal-responsive CopG/Arc/MetJ family transcriptional regulator